MNAQPDVSVIVLNWNGKQYLETCLSSLLKQNYPSFEIIFVDNGSTDGSMEFVNNKFPGVIALKHRVNLGFSQGVNSGIRIAKGKYIATINNDAEADPAWISELVRVMDRDSNIGSCASKMLRYYNRNIIDSAGTLVYQNGSAYDRGSLEIDAGQYDSQEEIFGACAGAALYRKEMLDEIGLFDEVYFAYLEDVDISFRMHLFGWKCIFVPDAVVYHMHSATSKQASTFKLFYLERNKLWNMWKYYSIPLLISQIPYTNIFYFRYISLFFKKIVKQEIINEEPVLNNSFISVVFAVLRAKFFAYIKFPHVLMQRWKLRRKGADMSLVEAWIIKGYKK